MTITSEDLKKVRQLSNVEFDESMKVEETTIIDSSHKQPVVLSKLHVSMNTAPFDRLWLPVSEANDLNLLVSWRLVSNEVTKSPVVETLYLLDIRLLLLELLVSLTGPHE